ncbi:MAG TPA: DEAD/DEAH box helicase [Gemmatimonadaceae bacterium]|nr:DEAD/DEAH box helicase [Gemmatimonadaceae bacterium]
MRDVRDPYLPADHDAFVAAEPPGGRVIVIAPTRAACETIELGFTLDIETVLWRERGEQLTALATARKPFGIVAGTGTGKTLAVRPIAQALLRTNQLRVGVINREREATPETPTWNVIIVTTGIARRWFQAGDILARDTIIVDEVHQTSAELELCLALGKRVGCRFIWLSATVDPTFYARYLNSADVVESSAFDPAKAAQVKVISRDPVGFLDDKFMQRVMKEKRGVGVFMPTRAMVEQVAADVSSRFPRLDVAHYHGGEPIRVIRPFLEGAVQPPFLLTMTAAGQSALNVQGLDTVVIDDTRFTNVIERGRNVLTRTHLGPNEILQMAGRVHGRVRDGRVFILSDRVLEFSGLRPVSPEFQLAGDSERVALTCAALGVRADELDLPVPLDRAAYRAALATLEERGVVENGVLTQYGRVIEALPVDRPWGELLAHVEDDMLACVAVMSGIESLHRMTREDRNLDGLIIAGSDHLTAYNVYAEAYRRHGYVGEVYGLERHLFHDDIAEWAERRGVLVKSVEDAALAMASVYRALRMKLPPELPLARDTTLRRFQQLLARLQPFSLVIDEETASGESARVSKTSVCGSWGAIAGDLRYFADRFGVARAAIEGTQIPRHLVRENAVEHAPEIVFDRERSQTPLVRTRRVTYFSFELEREDEPLREWRGADAPAARHALAVALARGEALHPAVRRNQADIDSVREAWRRSGGSTPRLTAEELTAMYEAALANVGDVHQWRAARLILDFDALVSREERARLARLPGAALVRDRTVPIEYDVETDADGRSFGVARLRLNDKLVRTLDESDLPDLDRPLRFAAHRGPRPAVRAASLAELKAALDASPDEPARRRDDGPRRKDGHGSRDQHRGRKGSRIWRGKPRGRRG